MTDQSTAALDQAAAEAVAEETQTEEIQEEQQAEETQTDETPAEEETAEVTEEGLPADHKERSDLGRKVSAMHRRMDEMTQTLSSLQSFLEANSQRRDENPIDPDEPLTMKDLQRYETEREKAKKREQKQYDDKYRNTVQGLGTDLTDEEWTAVVEEMKNIPLNSSNNPEIDAERNFYKAQGIYFRKSSTKSEKKVNPLKGERANTGVATTQKTVVKETKMPKLDADAQAYYDYVARTEGDEAARKLVKDLD